MKRLLATLLVLAAMLALCACTPKQEPKYFGIWIDETGENTLVLKQEGNTLKATFNGVAYSWEMAPQPEVDYGQPVYTVLYDTINFYEVDGKWVSEVIVPDDPTATEPEATEPEATEPEATEPVEGEEPEATEPEATEEATEPEATESSDVAVASEIPEATEAVEGEEPEATEPEATEEATEPEATDAPEKPEAPAVEEEERVILFTAKLFIKDGQMTLVLVDCATEKEMCTLIKRY